MNTNRTETAIVVFARAPEPGRVKTRLVPALGEAGAAALHIALLRRTLETAHAAATGALELWCTPGPDHPVIIDLAREFDAVLETQHGDDLGERMHHAIDAALARAPRALLIGCDCPELEASDLREGADALASGADVVIGPARDGGYYLIGLKSPRPALFRGLRWGADDVCARTCEIADGAGLERYMLAVHADVDRPADLAELEMEKGDRFIFLGGK